MEEEKFLIDSNIIIYYLDGKIPESHKEKVTTQPVQRVHKQIFATDYADVTD